MSFRARSAALVLCLATTAPAFAQTAEQDVRCLLASNVFGATEKDPMRKQMALATALFFAGRADAHIPPATFKTLLAAQGKALTEANTPAVMTTCAKQFQARERALQQMGREVAQAQQPKPAAAPAAKK